MDNLPILLSKKPFTYQEACEHGLTQYMLRKLIEASLLERVEHGVYCATGHDWSDEEQYKRAVNKTGQPSAICLISALSYYDLTDTIPRKVWVMLDAKRRVKSDYIKPYRARDPKWAVGIDSHDDYSVTNLERTIVDSLTHSKLVPARLGIDALKLALREEKTTVGAILKMADLLGVRHRILKYVEALS